MEKYRPVLSLKDIELAIKLIKDFFERALADSLSLQRVTAPFFVKSGMGLNDDLNGIDKPVSFCVKQANCDVEVVQSLAKWKRYALKRYGFKVGEGLYTDMNAIRPNEVLDEIHSFYVDQWDWCKIIAKKDFKILEQTVKLIYKCICETEKFIIKQYPHIKPQLPAEIYFITSQELLDKFPTLTPKERENKICQEYGAVFIIGIGGNLSDGVPHDFRAPDYDDWISVRPDGGCGLNGDILVWNSIINRAFELSSMGIRVDAESLKRQLQICHCEERMALDFHKMLLTNQLPQTIGGGIGQSRLCMYLLRCAHIGEVACGIWPEDMQQTCAMYNINLL